MQCGVLSVLLIHDQFWLKIIIKYLQIQNKNLKFALFIKEFLEINFFKSMATHLTFNNFLRYTYFY